MGDRESVMRYECTQENVSKVQTLTPRHLCILTVESLHELLEHGCLVHLTRFFARDSLTISRQGGRESQRLVCVAFLILVF